MTADTHPIHFVTVYIVTAYTHLIHFVTVYTVTVK